MALFLAKPSTVVVEEGMAMEEAEVVDITEVEVTTVTEGVRMAEEVEDTHRWAEGPEAVGEAIILRSGPITIGVLG